MDVTVYTITFNEELLMQFFIDHYRSRFPRCNIVIFENQSTDRTAEICFRNGCDIRHYDSGGKLNELGMFTTKNNCWRDAKTDWVIVCDVDELLDINSEQLEEEAAQGVTKIKSESWQMVNMEDNLDFKNMKYGFRDPNEHECFIYDKDLCFNKKLVDINYTHAGCHYCDSKGIIKESSKRYRMYHYRYINCDALCAKRRLTAERRNETDIKNHWGIHCTFGDEFFKTQFQQMRDGAIKIL